MFSISEQFLNIFALSVELDRHVHGNVDVLIEARALISRFTDLLI